MRINKAHIRIPTTQYGYIEFEIEAESAMEMKDFHDIQVKKFQEKYEGLPDKEWRNTLDRYLTQGDMEADKYAEMNTGQKLVIQEIKRAFARINK